METMMWLLYQIDPVMQFLYVVCDWLLGWVERFGGIGGILAVSVLTGVGVNLFQKYFSDQKLLGKCKADLDRLKPAMSAARKADDKELVARLGRVAGRITNKSLVRTMLPSLWTIPPVILVVLWAASRLAWEPVRPGEPVEVVANFEDYAGGYAVLKPQGGVELMGPSIAAVKLGEDTPEAKAKRIAAAEAQHPWFHLQGKNPFKWIRKETDEERKARIDAAGSSPNFGVEAHWKVRPTAAGEHKLTVCYCDQSFTVDLPVSASGGRPPDALTIFRWSSPTQDQFQSLNFPGLRDNMPVAWWNLWLQWMGLYIIAAVGLTVGLRFAMGIK